MIYDVFLFNGELDMLELRLNILGDKVDRFIICEATQTFSEEYKKSQYILNKKRFEKWNHKIVHFQFNLMEDPELVEQARNSPNTERGNPYWMKVYYAMEMMRQPLEWFCNDHAIIYISDIDEIWSKVLFPHDDVIYGFEQLVYYYQLNNRCSEPWTGSICTNYRRLKKEIINNIKQKGEVKIPDGGWHFTYQGGEKMIEKKINNSKHPDQGVRDSYYGVPTETLMANIKQGKDFFGRDYKFWVEEENWPEYLKNNRHLYLHMLK